MLRKSMLRKLRGRRVGVNNLLSLTTLPKYVQAVVCFRLTTVPCRLICVYSCSRLQNARNVLCNEESRKRYDFWRRSGIAVPYEQWVELSGAVHTSLHWAAKPRKELMLDYRKGNTKIVPSQLHRGARKQGRI